MRTLRVPGGQVRLMAPPQRQTPKPTASDLRAAADALLAAPPTQDTDRLLAAVGDLDIRAARLESKPAYDPIDAEATKLVQRMRAEATA